MVLAEQRDRTPLEPRVEKALWLFENAGAPEPIRQYTRDKLTAFYLTLGGDPKIVTPKKLTKGALGILNEVVEAAEGNKSDIEPRFIMAAQYALKPEPGMASIALDSTKGELVRGIKAMAMLCSFQEKDFQLKDGKGSFYLDSALLVIANELIERNKNGQIEPETEYEIISIDVKPPIQEVHEDEGLKLEVPQTVLSMEFEVSTDRFKALFDKGRDFRSLRNRERPLKEEPLERAVVWELSPAKGSNPPTIASSPRLERAVERQRIAPKSDRAVKKVNTKVAVVQAVPSTVRIETGTERLRSVVENYMQELEDLRQKGIRTVKKNGGVIFLLTQDGEDYDFVQDGRVRIRSKAGKFRYLELKDVSDTVILAALRKKTEV